MEFKTSISKMTKEDMILRGKQHADLIAYSSFSDTIFLLLRGRGPTSNESRIFSALLVSCIDHGMGTASSMTSRFVMSTGNKINTAVGAGVLALGDYHGGAIEPAMKQIQEIKDIDNYVKESLEQKKILYGFGHKIYKDHDPRVTAILSICAKVKYSSKFIDTVQTMESAIEKHKGKKIPLNIDGLMAAIFLEMGFTPNAARGIFIIARTPGLVAQAVEEKENEKPVRRIAEEDIKYEGD